MKKYFTDKNLPFWLFAFSVLILLTVPKLIQDGMFLDGMLYTSVSHNLGNGIGSFWSLEFSPSYSCEGSTNFHEHPPLVFGIQSLFYRLLGDSMYIERFYTFLTMCLTAFLINLAWKNIFSKAQEGGSIGWLPVILWITIPACFWSYTNNMMENSMGIFALSSVIITYRALDTEKHETGYLLLSGLFIFFATMSKGVPGFFPLSVPFIYWIVFRKKSPVKVILQTLIVLSVPAILYLVLFNLPKSGESLSFYVFNRLLLRVNDNPTVTSRFYILKRLITELLPLFVIIVLIIITNRLKSRKPYANDNIKTSIFFILTGLAAAAPLALTMVQRGFYLVPSLPYFAIGSSLLVAPIVLNFREKILSDHRTYRIIKISGVVLLGCAMVFSFMQIGKTSRDRDLLHDVHLIGKTIPVKSELTINYEIAQTYILECYFIRYYNISLYIDQPKEYLLITKNTEPPDSTEFRKLNLETLVFDIYKTRQKKP